MRVEEALTNNINILILTITMLSLFENENRVNYLTKIISNNTKIKDLTLSSALNKCGGVNSIFDILFSGAKKTNLDLVLESMAHNKSIKNLTISSLKDIRESVISISNL
jgi:hypothetical protein